MYFINPDCLRSVMYLHNNRYRRVSEMLNPIAGYHQNQVEMWTNLKWV